MREGHPVGSNFEVIKCIQTTLRFLENLIYAGLHLKYSINKMGSFGFLHYSYLLYSSFRYFCVEIKPYL